MYAHIENRMLINMRMNNSGKPPFSKISSSKFNQVKFLAISAFLQPQRKRMSFCLKIEVFLTVRLYLFVSEIDPRPLC